jgi:hypothetical protein
MKRADLPLVDEQAEGLLGEVLAEPDMARADEEDADRGAERNAPARNARQRQHPAGGSGAEPEAGHPDRLPREEIEGSGFLQRNLQVGEVDDGVVDHVAEAELREQPDEGAPGEHDSPSHPQGRGQDERGEEQKQHVHGEDVEQRRAIEQQRGADDGGGGMI